MHAQIGEGDLAARFYRMASDAAQEKIQRFYNREPDKWPVNDVSGQPQWSGVSRFYRMASDTAQE